MALFDKPLFTFEMANNHQGDVEHGKKIIRELKQVTEKYEQYFAYCKSYNLTGWTAGPFLPWQPQTKCIEIERFIKEHLNGYLAADSIYEQNDHLETIGGLLPEFYDTDSLCAVAKDVIDCEKTETDLRNIQKDLELSLKVCFGLTDEELAELPTMTDEEVLLLLEEKHER